jgi:hypothetical protein
MKVIRSISSIILALLVLAASSSFYVGVHSCGGTVNAVAFMQEADGCGHQSLPPCHRQLMKGCCENESIVHQGEDFKTYSTQITIAASPFVDVVLPSVLLAEVIPSAVISKTYYYNYDPPLRATDRTIDLQVFLI